MDSIAWMFGIFGLIAFCSMGSLKKRIRKLETQMRGEEMLDEATDVETLRLRLEVMIGQMVIFSFYEDDGDIDLLCDGVVRVVDVDEKWVLVHAEEGKRTMDRLLRISSIRSVEIRN